MPRITRAIRAIKQTREKRAERVIPKFRQSRRQAPCGCCYHLSVRFCFFRPDTSSPGKRPNRSRFWLGRTVLCNGLATNDWLMTRAKERFCLTTHSAKGEFFGLAPSLLLTARAAVIKLAAPFYVLCLSHSENFSL